jgi:hypothetical protein
MTNNVSQATKQYEEVIAPIFEDEDGKIDHKATKTFLAYVITAYLMNLAIDKGKRTAMFAFEELKSDLDRIIPAFIARTEARIRRVK